MISKSSPSLYLSSSLFISSINTPFTLHISSLSYAAWLLLNLSIFAENETESYENCVCNSESCLDTWFNACSNWRCDEFVLSNFVLCWLIC